MQSQKCGVRRNHEPLVFRLVQRELRNTEGLVLIISRLVSLKVSAFRNAPGNLLSSGIRLLHPDDCGSGTLQERIRVGLHPEGRHQVLEHSACPRKQNGTAVFQSVCPSQQKPCFLWDLFFGDCHERGGSGLRSQKIIGSRVQLPVLDIESD